MLAESADNLEMPSSVPMTERYFRQRMEKTTAWAAKMYAVVASRMLELQQEKI